jgi:hypothetical protein
MSKNAAVLRVYIGFDDTDNREADRGTGKLARWFENQLPEGCHLWGVIRQQLFIHRDIPYTSHNSAACVTVDMLERSMLAVIIDRAVEHIQSHALQGSDPGVCVASSDHLALRDLMHFGRRTAMQLTTQKAALTAAGNAHLSGHGGTNDGIIGAAAAVGLTAAGWSGRFIEFGRLRRFPAVVQVSELEQAGIGVISIDRQTKMPAPADRVYTKSWLRPRLLGNRAILLAQPRGDGRWESLGEKRKKEHSSCQPAACVNS